MSLARVALLGAVLVSAPRVVQAQDTSAEAAVAQTLEQATAALRREAWPEAIALCDRVLRVRSSASVRYCLAVSHDRLDRPLEAYLHAGLCRRELRAEPAPRPWMQQGCDDIERRRRAQVATVRIELEGEAPPGLRVLVNGQPVSATVVGLELPVLAGSVTVRAGAEGWEEAVAEARVAAGETRAVSLRLRRAPGPVAPVIEMRRRVWEAVLGGVMIAGGATAAGLGGYNLAVHGAQEGDAAAHTIRQRCALGAATQTTAQGTQCGDVGAVTPVLLGAGVAVLGVGVFLLVDGLRPRPVARVSVRPHLTIGRGETTLGVDLAF